MTLKDNNTPSLPSCFSADHLIVHLPISPANLTHLALGNTWVAPVHVVEDPKGLLPLAGLPSLQVNLDFFLLYRPSSNYLGPRRGFQSFIFKFPSFDITDLNFIRVLNATSASIQQQFDAEQCILSFGGVIVHLLEGWRG